MKFKSTLHRMLTLDQFAIIIINADLLIGNAGFWKVKVLTKKNISSSMSY